MSALEVGQPIVDLGTGEERFRLVELLARGRHHDIVVAEDTHLDDKRVVVKAIRYDTVEDPQDIRARREALREELSLLTLPSPLLPEPLDWLTIANPQVPAELNDTEPLLVYELQHGRVLLEKMRSAGGDGVETARALKIVREIAIFLRLLHRHDHVFRCMAPEHVLVDLDDIIHVIGVGNAVSMVHEPEDFRQLLEHPFVAPELRELTARKQVRPAADIYSLGGILAFMLTARQPLLVVESPFDDAAFHRLGQRGPGLARLVARMMHSNPKKRFQTIDDLLPHLDPLALPDPGHPDLQDVELPSPWKQPPPRGPASQLSPGPLVSTPRQGDESVAGTGAPSKTDGDESGDQVPVKSEKSAIAKKERRLAIVATVMGGLAVASVIAVILLALL